MLLAYFISFSSISPAKAAETLKKNQQRLEYNVFAGGLHALQSDLIIDLSHAGQYSIDLSAKTFGLLGKLAPWEGTFSSYGWNNNGTFQSKEHQSTAIWRKEKEIKNYTYNKDSSFEKFQITDDENDGKVKKIDKELTDQTSDILTATLNTLQTAAKTNKCEGTTDIFDGKRRYQVIFKNKKTVQLQASRYNAYQGPALECTVEVKPIAGKWHQKPRGWLSIQEQGRERGTMPTVWLAKIASNQPAVPIKVRVKTSYGTLFMQMTRYELMQDNGVKKTLTLEK